MPLHFSKTVNSPYPAFSLAGENPHAAALVSVVPITLFGVQTMLAAPGERALALAAIIQRRVMVFTRLSV
jgi:hypothetical protein